MTSYGPCGFTINVTVSFCVAAYLAISRAEAKVNMKTLLPTAGLIFALMHFSVALPPWFPSLQR